MRSGIGGIGDACLCSAWVRGLRCQSTNVHCLKWPVAVSNNTRATPQVRAKGRKRKRRVFTKKKKNTRKKRVILNIWEQRTRGQRLTGNGLERFLGRRLWSSRGRHWDRPIWPKWSAPWRMHPTGPYLCIEYSQLPCSPICNYMCLLSISPV